MSTNTEHFAVPLKAGTHVRIYRNLHARSWSVQTKGPDGKGPWRVAGHAVDVFVGNATFRVSERGRQRVLRTGVKNVHAFVLGTLLDADDAYATPTLVMQAAYDPRKLPHFFAPDWNDRMVDGGERVHLDEKGKLWIGGSMK